MELKKNATFLTSFIIVCIAFIASVQSAPNNATAPVTGSATNKTTPVVVTAAPGNKTSNSSDEDCEPEPESVAGNATKTSGDRQGKQLNPGENEKYVHDAAKFNTTTASPGDAAKLQGNSSTTQAPAIGGAPTSHFANVILVLVSFVYATL